MSQFLQSDFYAYAVIFLVLLVLPLGGLGAAVLIGASPGLALTRRWARIYAALATAYSLSWTAYNWNPYYTLATALSLSTVALAGLALAMALALRRPPARTPIVVRVLGVIACALAGIWTPFAIVFFGSSGS